MDAFFQVPTTVKEIPTCLKSKVEGYWITQTPLTLLRAERPLVSYIVGLLDLLAIFFRALANHLLSQYC